MGLGYHGAAGASGANLGVLEARPKGVLQRYRQLQVLLVDKVPVSK